MSVRIYLDANIYLDYCEKRGNGVRPLQEFAFWIFKRAFECEFEIVISNFVLREIKNNLKNETQLQVLLADLKAKKKLIYVESSHEERCRAEKYSNWADALHAILARRAGCKFIVTRNIMDFLQFSGILEPKLPEQL